MSKIKSAVRSISNFQIFKTLLSINYTGYLKEKEWLQSVLKKESSILGNPIPWFTYPAIDFLDERIKNNLDVLEFGSGNSTLWFAKRAKSVLSIESNQIWFDKIKSLVPSNSRLLLNCVDNENHYHRIINKIDDKFDIVLVDAIDRVNCMISSVKLLRSGGIIILDNSDRSLYNDGMNFLIKNNFKKIDFWGMAPIVLSKSCTTIFYKSNNCLDI